MGDAIKEAKRAFVEGGPKERAEAVRNLIGYEKEKEAASLVLTHLLKEQNEDVKEAIWEFLKSLKGEKVREMVVRRIFRYEDPDARAQLLIVAWSYRTPEGEGAVLKGLTDKVGEVRQTAAELIAKAKEEGRPLQFLKRAISKLIEALTSDENLRTRKAVLTALRALTEKDFGFDHKRWRKWWKRTERSYKGSGISERDGKGGGRTVPVPAEPRKTPRFFGEKIRKHYVIFVMDESSSMTARMASKQRKFKAVREELINAIKAMDKHYMFNIIFFSDKVTKWCPTLVKATKKNKKAAIEFINSRKPYGNTNIYDALKSAMEDPRVRLIIFLTDGKPTVGVTDKEKILSDIAKWNKQRRHRVQINTIGFIGIGLGAQFADPDFLRRLAEQNNGKCKLMR